MAQGNLFETDFANRLRARSLARRDDPATSHQAAQRVVESGRLTGSQWTCWTAVREFGPGTAREIVAKWERARAVAYYHELCRRLPELARKGLVRGQRDAEGREVVRDGSRVWEVVP